MTPRTQKITEKWQSAIGEMFEGHYEFSIRLVLRDHGVEIKKIADEKERSNFFFKKVNEEFKFWAITNRRHLLIAEYRRLLQDHYPEHELLKLPDKSPEFGHHVDEQIKHCKAVWWKEYLPKIMQQQK